MDERGYFQIEGFPRRIGELPTCLCAYGDGMIDRTLRAIQQFLGFLAKALRHGCAPFCECRREHNRSLSHRRPRTTAWPVMAEIMRRCVGDCEVKIELASLRALNRNTERGGQ